MGSKKIECVSLDWKCDPGCSLPRSKKKIFPFWVSPAELETGTDLKPVTAPNGVNLLKRLYRIFYDFFEFLGTDFSCVMTL
jgi:hypothetical protein